MRTVISRLLAYLQLKYSTVGAAGQWGGWSYELDSYSVYKVP